MDYFEKWAPTVSWATVRMLLCLTLSQGWVTKQVDFSNAFVQATLNESVFVAMPDVESAAIRTSPSESSLQSTEVS